MQSRSDIFFKLFFFPSNLQASEWFGGAVAKQRTISLKGGFDKAAHTQVASTLTSNKPVASQKPLDDGSDAPKGEAAVSS